MSDKSKRCRHYDSWLIPGGNHFLWEWCYRCGAIRRLVSTSGKVCRPVTQWKRPVGADGANPWPLIPMVTQSTTPPAA